MPSESIIDKIRKLQALAERAGTEAEASAAAERVRELLLKHNLDIGVATLKEEEGVVEAVEREFKRLRPYHNILAGACKELFNVEVCWTRYRLAGRLQHLKFSFIGLRSNVQAACVTFLYLCDSIDALARGWRLRYELEVFDTWTAVTNTFKIGASDRIVSMAREHTRQFQAERTGVNEIIHIANAVAVKRLAQIKARGERPPTQNHWTFSPQAYDDGYREGGRIDIHGARNNRFLKE